jgi:hypothetical protein
VPTDTETKNEPKLAPTPTNPAANLLDTLSKESAANRKQEAAKDDSKWLYAHWCRRGHPAFFYTENPGQGIVTPDKWYSRYKRQDEPWRGNIPCQECSHYDEEGFISHEELTQLNYQRPVKRMTAFIADQRFLYRIGKTEEQRKKHPPHRANVLNITAGNVGVPNPDFPESVKTIRRRELVEANVAVK